MWRDSDYPGRQIADVPAPDLIRTVGRMTGWFLDTTFGFVTPSMMQQPGLVSEEAATVAKGSQVPGTTSTAPG